jgi:hypothetical protein
MVAKSPPRRFTFCGDGRVAAGEERRMWIEAGALGGLIIHGNPEEWEWFGAKLEALCAELTHDVLPAATNPTGSVNVTLQEALAIMAVMEDEALIRSLMGVILGRRPSPPDPP